MICITLPDARLRGHDDGENFLTGFRYKAI
jgi:hypothetical protein